MWRLLFDAERANMGAEGLWTNIEWTGLGVGVEDA